MRVGVRFVDAREICARSSDDARMLTGESEGHSPQSRQSLALQNLSFRANKRPTELRNHDVNVLYQCVTARDPELPDVPTTVELGSTKEATDLLAFYTSSAEVGQSILAPPGVPVERAEALRSGFEAMLRDPDFLAAIAKTQMVLRPASAATIQKIVIATTHAPSAITGRIISI
jgi:hypothetical protein